MQIRNKPIILLVAEAVTLAHFARITTLAKALDPALYEVVVASDPRYIDLEVPLGYRFYPIRSISFAEFSKALSQGNPLYHVDTLTRYTEEDLVLFDNIKPDLIIGDFRLSLAVSAPLRKIPYAALVNAYWSPFADTIYPVPDMPMTRILGISLAQKLFDLVRPTAFAIHARPLNQVRQRFGLPSLGTDLRNAYTWGDYTLYADSPEVIPTHNLPAHHHYLGPIYWSAQVPLPTWWDDLPEDKPVVFLTLGSSGQESLLPMMLAVLSRLPVTVVAATAGKILLTDMPANTYVADYLPMNMIAQRSQLIISNGGSLTTYQALSNGIPVIGLCSNMDQLLNMMAVERLGAGLTRRAANISSACLAAMVNDVLYNSSYARAASLVRQILLQYDSNQRFPEIVMEILHPRK